MRMTANKSIVDCVLKSVMERLNDPERVVREDADVWTRLRKVGYSEKKGKTICQMCRRDYCEGRLTPSPRSVKHVDI